MDSLLAAYAEEEEEVEDVGGLSSQECHSSSAGEKRARSSPFSLSSSSSSAAEVHDSPDDDNRRKKKKQKRGTKLDVAQFESVPSASSSVTSAFSLPNPFAEPSSSSSSSVQMTPTAAAAFKRPLPDVTNNPKLHQGRTRSFEHVEGNWPTHIFIPFHPSNEEAFARAIEEAETGLDNENPADDAPWTRIIAGNESVPTLLSSAGTNLPSSSSSSAPSSIAAGRTSSPTSLHLSLSRTFTLRFDQIAPFEFALRKVIQQFFRAHADTFQQLRKSSDATPKQEHQSVTTAIHMEMAHAKEYLNEERTRKFCAMLFWPTNEQTQQACHTSLDAQDAIGGCIGTCTCRRSLSFGQSLVRLIREVDQLAQLYGATPYHLSPELHVTVAWKLMQAPSASRNGTSPSSRCVKLRVPVEGFFDEIRCHIGNRVYRFPVATQIDVVR